MAKLIIPAGCRPNQYAQCGPLYTAIKRAGRLLAAIMMINPVCANATEILVAVASNFRPAMESLQNRFESASHHRLALISGSTGKHYAQITNGAPFDVFLAADAEHPRRLESGGFAMSGSRFTYAIGKLVLWSPRPGFVDATGQVLEHGDFRHLAIANPQLAPYGRAGREVLQARGLWDQLSTRLVRGENIAQAFQFVESGNAELGFVAWSQVKRPDLPVAGSFWMVPQDLYQPIEQQAIVLKDSEASQSLWRFMRSPQALKIILDHGYVVP